MEFNQIELAPLAPLDNAEPSPDGAEVFVPEKVCAKAIRYVVEDNKLSHVSFTGGCDGNLKALSVLMEGMPVDDVVEKLSGITCGKKTTSCVDQLCNALREHK